MRRCPSPQSSDANPPDQEIPSTPELEAVYPLEPIILRELLRSSSPKGDHPSPPKTFRPPPSSSAVVSSKSGRPTNVLHLSLQPIDQTSLTARRYPTLTRGLNCVISDADHQWYVPPPRDQFGSKVLYEYYCSKVKSPIHLAVIVERTEQPEPYYVSEDEALEDVRRVFSNAVTYHRGSTFWFRAAQKLSAMFERNCAPKRRRSTTLVSSAVKKRRLLKEVCVSKRRRPVTRSNPPANEFHFVVGKLNGRLYTSKCRQLSKLIHEQLPNITYDYVEGLMHSTRYDAFCATKSKKTVVGGLLCKAFREQDFIELCFLVVSTRYQRQGCGIALMDSLKKYARGQGIKWILTYADLTAKGFFRRCGFSKGTSLPFKAWEEAIYHYTRSELMSFQVI